jgi:hypothetical protein
VKTMRSLFGTLSLIMFAISAASAAKPETSKKQLEKDATHIIAGKVQAISQVIERAGEYGITRYVAEILIDNVEKGNDLKAGDIIHARYLRKVWRGSGAPPPGDSGHWPIPQRDDSVRVYLTHKGYNGAGYTADGGYDVYYKNGFEILVAPTQIR